MQIHSYVILYFAGCLVLSFCFFRALRKAKKQFNDELLRAWSLTEKALTYSKSIALENARLRAIVQQYKLASRRICERYVVLANVISSVQPPSWEFLGDEIKLIVTLEDAVGEISDWVKQYMSSLPPYIEFEGIFFEPVIIKNGGSEVRLVLRINDVDEGSPHYDNIKKDGCFENRLRDWSICDHLWMREHISDEYSMAFAIADCAEFLEKNNLKK